MHCDACGTENRAGSKFCDNCGSSLAAICAQCGQANRADARFCANCGVTLGEATRRAAESAIVFEAIGDHSLKGKTSPVPAWQALRVVAQRGGHGRADTLEAPFVGRDEELRQVPMLLALRAAIWSGNLDRTRQVAALRADVPSGTFGHAEIVHANAAVAALEARTADALGGFREVRDVLGRLEQEFDAATRAVDAAILLPDEPEVRAWAEEVRPLLVRLRAAPYLTRLDEALASALSPTERSTSAEVRSGQPTR